MYAVSLMQPCSWHVISMPRKCRFLCFRLTKATCRPCFVRWFALTCWQKRRKRQVFGAVKKRSLLLICDVCCIFSSDQLNIASKNHAAGIRITNSLLQVMLIAGQVMLVAGLIVGGIRIGCSPHGPYKFDRKTMSVLLVAVALVGLAMSFSALALDQWCFVSWRLKCCLHRLSILPVNVELNVELNPKP